MSTSEQPEEPQPPDRYAEFVSLLKINKECLCRDTHVES